MSELKPGGRLPDPLPADPMHWADGWLKEATAAGVQRNPNSMTLSTVDDRNRPSSRVVLCKAFVPDPGYLVFYTNYQSAKVRELDQNAHAAAVFHWDALGRQVRIEGLTVRSPDAESDAYFATRDWGSQLGAWGSDQSREIGSRDALMQQIRDRGRKLGLDFVGNNQTLTSGEVPEIPRPPHWGGIRLWARSVELWIEGPDRIHDRGRYTRELAPAGPHEYSVTPWSASRLQP